MSSDPLQQIAGGKIAPVYLVVGDPFLADQLILALKQAFSHGGDENVETVRADEVKPEKIIAGLHTVSMFGGDKLAIVRGCELLKADLLAQYLSYVQAPSPQACLALVATKLDARSRLVQAVKENGVYWAGEALKERGAARWVVDEAVRQNVRLAGSAAQRIVDAVGPERSALAAAIERVSLYTNGEPVTELAVEAVLSQTRERSIFELTRAVGDHKRELALQVLRQMIAAREPGLRIVAMLARHLRQLWIAKEMAEQRQAPNEIARAAGMSPYFVRDLIQQAACFDQDQLTRMHDALCTTDAALKSTRLSEEVLLNQLVLTFLER